MSTTFLTTGAFGKPCGKISRLNDTVYWTMFVIVTNSN